MSEPFVGEIRMIGFSFAPQGWAFCDGSVLSIAQNDVLFNLIGTTYGGDGVQTFALPNLLGRTPIHFSANVPIGASGGSETVALTAPQIPMHSHSLAATTASPSSSTATGNLLSTSGVNIYTPPSHVVTTASTTTPTGNGAPHDNMMPYLCINFAISLFGVFPSRN